jgi:hypothetical protein
LLAFSLILSLSLVACKDGGGGSGNGGNGGNGGGGATIVTNSDGSSAISDVQVKDATNITNTSISAADLPNYAGTLDFGYLSGGPDYVDIFTDIAPGSSVKVTNGKLNMTLGNVTGGKLRNASYFFSGESGSSNVTITPSDTKGYCIFDTAFRTSDVTYMLICGKKMTATSQEAATLFYVDKDCTVKGKISGSTEIGNNPNVDCSFKKGWNYFYWEFNVNDSTAKCSSSQTLPSSYYWVVAKPSW